MKSKIKLFLGSFLLLGGVYFFTPEAQARTCNGSQRINNDGLTECGRSGEGCMRQCGFLEMK